MPTGRLLGASGPGLGRASASAHNLAPGDLARLLRASRVSSPTWGNKKMPGARERQSPAGSWGTSLCSTLGRRGRLCGPRGTPWSGRAAAAGGPRGGAGCTSAAGSPVLTNPPGHGWGGPVLTGPPGHGWGRTQNPAGSQSLSMVPTHTLGPGLSPSEFKSPPSDCSGRLSSHHNDHVCGELGLERCQWGERAPDQSVSPAPLPAWGRGLA